MGGWVLGMGGGFTVGSGYGVGFWEWGVGSGYGGLRRRVRGQPPPARLGRGGAHQDDVDASAWFTSQRLKPLVN
jgi:hypothetical protein